MENSLKEILRQGLGKVSLTYGDEYDSSVTYKKATVVFDQTGAYISKKDTKGNPTSDTNYWQLICRNPRAGIDYFKEEDKQEIVNNVTQIAESDFNKYYNDKVSDFNSNITTKVNEFNSDVENKTKEFNDNADSKTTAFDNNVKDKTNTLNSNVTSKTNTFNTNATNKTNAFNTNANTKQTAYDTNATSKLKTYNDNHTEKLAEYNNNHNTKLADYNQNANDKMNDFDENVKNQINHYNNSVSDFETVLDIVTPKQNVRGNEIVIDDALPLPIFEVKIEGRSHQNTTTGKNKIGFADMTEKTVQGVTASILDNVMTLSGQNSQIYAINVSKSLNVNLSADADTSCTLSYKVLNGQKNVKLGISFRDENDTQLDYIQDINTTDLSTTKVISADTINQTHYFNFFVRTQEVLSDLKIIVQLEFNSAATEVEVYTGGKPSPSPEYPQQIKSIENSINIKVTNNLDINDENYKEKLLTLDLKNNSVSSLSNEIKDYVISDKRKYWLIKNIEKITLNGSENWDVLTTSAGVEFRTINNSITVNSSSSNIANILSDRLTVTSPSVMWNNVGNYITIANTSPRILISLADNTITTVDEFKTWLSENSVTLYYQLAEPEIVELGELEEPIKNFEGVNNIQVLTNLDTEFEVKYALDIKKYIDKQNGLQDTQTNQMNTLLSSTATADFLLQNLQNDLESEV